MIIEPGFAACPPNNFTPRRCPAESRPKDVEPPAFLCAIRDGGLVYGIMESYRSSDTIVVRSRIPGNRFAVKIVHKKSPQEYRADGMGRKLLRDGLAGRSRVSLLDSPPTHRQKPGEFPVVLPPSDLLIFSSPLRIEPCLEGSAIARYQLHRDFLDAHMECGVAE